MFREFNVKFEDVEMLGGADNLLEGTEITKVIVRGDNNKMSSLDSMLKNCNELDTVDGELDLNGVGDIDNLLEGTELVKSINLKNINNENISANNSFPHVDRINIGGELYNKKAMQNVIASKDWTFDNITYNGTVGDNIVTKEVNIVDDNEATIQDTLEQKARGFEIIGQTYENLVVGNGEVTLIDELTLESIDGSPNEFNPHIEQPVCVEVIEGNTVQDESNIYSIGELQENGTYKIDILSIKPLAKINDFESGRLDRGVLGYASDSIIQIKDGNIECTTLIGWRGCTSGFAKVNPNTEYSFDYNIVSNGIDVIPCPHFYTKDKVYISDLYNKSTFTTPSNAEYVRIYFTCGVVGSFTIKDFDFSNKSTQSILLPQPLNKIGDIKDKFYWDDNKGHYCIEQNIDENLEVLDIPNIIDLPHLNKKYSLDTYMPTTYVECTNNPMQPSRLLLESDTVRYKHSTLEADTDYTVQFECKEKSDKKVKLNLGGTEKEVDAVVGLNHVSITTPSELSKDRLYLSGAGNKVADVIVAKGEMSQYPNYFDGVQNTGELQDDGTYKIDIETSSEYKEVNIFNSDIYSMEDGTIDISSGINQNYANESRVAQFIPCVANTEYRVEIETSGVYGYICYYYDANKKYLGCNKEANSFYAITEDKFEQVAYVRFRINKPVGSYNNVKLLGQENTTHKICITSNSPLTKGDKLYWNKSNKRYEIDRGGNIEVPTVSGDVIDLPRLYQRDGTNINISTGNIKPAKTKIVYKDII